MVQFLTVLLCVVILFGCIGAAFGLWNLVDSRAAERAMSDIAAEVANVIKLFGKGLLALLIAVSVGAVAMGIGGGLRAGGEAFGKGAAWYAISQEMAAQIGADNVERATLPGGFTTLQIPQDAIERPEFKYLGEGTDEAWPPRLT